MYPGLLSTQTEASTTHQIPFPIANDVVATGFAISFIASTPTPCNVRYRVSGGGNISICTEYILEISVFIASYLDE